jgi:asparagine synthase (glutamine-hydrolysing)
MCGIIGYISRGRREDKQPVIKEMADAIRHRGPDGEGYYIDEDIALGHRRLSIIDLEGGT